MSTILNSWGLSVPQPILDEKGQPASYWGARAIFQPRLKNPIDLLPDRQCFTPHGVESPMLLDWLNREALPWLREEVKRLSLDSNEIVQKISHNKGIIASPRGSHGYLYVGAWRHNTKEAAYELPEPPPNVRIIGQDEVLTEVKTLDPESIKFSGGPIPAKGTKVKVTINSIGPGTVVDYFVEHGFLGLRVKLDAQPEWHKKQNGGWPYALVFGAEVKVL